MLSPQSVPPVLRVAIIRSSSIGDVVLATACLDLLAKLGMPLEICWVGRSPSLELIQAAWPNLRCQFVQSSFAEGDREALLRSLSTQHWIVDLQGSLRSRHLCLSLWREYRVPSHAVAQQSIGRTKMVFKARLRGRRYEAKKEAFVPRYKLLAESMRQTLHKHLPVEFLDRIANYQPVPRLPTAHDEEHRSWQKELKFGRWIALAPGAMYEPKRAPLNLFAGVASELRRLWQKHPLDDAGLGLLVLGNQSERELGIRLLESLQWPFPVLNLAGKLSLWESALALKEAEMLLCNDSSLGHIAEAVGTPVSVLFGPTIEAFGFAPWRLESAAFSVPLGCRPCSKHGDETCRYQDQLCFQNIAVGDVARHIWTYLQVPAESE